MKSILLLHGWNDDNYTSRTKSTDAWDNRKDFVDILSKNYKIYTLNFPGFCGSPEPSKSWYLKDYLEYVYKYIKDNNIKTDYILGYSFGGAVATLYIYLKDPTQKIILVSPAITRTNVKPDITRPNIIRRLIRSIYLRYVIKNKYMINGTKFLSNSYQNIVRIELINELNSINPDNVLIIYGDKDEMVDPYKVYNSLNDKLKKRVIFIKDGMHDIANTHTDELISIISKYGNKIPYFFYYLI